MAKPNYIELGDRSSAIRIPIVYEDRAVLAVDKPAHWMLVPFTWQRTDRNLQAAIVSSIASGHFWARSRNLKFLRNVHRLDADTTGILLFAKSMGAVDTFSNLFEGRQMQKTYLAVVHGTPKQNDWTCKAKLGQDPQQVGRMRVDNSGKESETHFHLLKTEGGLSLVEARPVTGRTHQIRVHLLAAGLPIVGDDLYGNAEADAACGKWSEAFPMALRAVELAYRDPFTGKPIRIKARAEEFVADFGFSARA